MKVEKSLITSQGVFDSSMLFISDMMEVHDNAEHLRQYEGCILLKIFSKFVLLDNPNVTWELSAKIKGRKLQPGESINLIQE